MNTPEQVVQRQLEAYNARDLEAFAATYSPTITITNHADNQVVMNGIAQVRQAYGNLFANSPNLHCEILQRMAFGNYVIDREYVTGRGNAPSLNVVVIYEVKEGLIQRTWVLRE